MKKIHSIHLKIVLLSVIPMLIIALILSGYAFIGGLNNTLAAIKSSINETSNISAQALKNKLSIYETAINEAASNEIFQSENLDSETVMAFLEEVKNRNRFARVGYTDANGINQNGSDFSEREYFKECHHKLKAVTSDPYQSKENNGTLSVLFCAPIVRNGKFSGIVYGAADAELFSSIIKDVVVGANGENFIIDSSGTIIAHNDYSVAKNAANYITEAQNNPKLTGYANVISEMLENKSGSIEYNKDGKKRIASYVPINKGSGWVLAVTVNVFDFISRQLIGLIVIFVFSLAVIAVTIILISRLALRITKPISGCIDRIERLADGDLASDTGECKTNDEIGVLVESTGRNIRHLNSMIRHISETLEKMSDGDFTGSTEGKFRGDFFPIKASLDNIIETMRSMLTEIDRTSMTLSEISHHVVNTSCILSDGVKNQTVMVNEIHDAFAGMRENVRLNAQNTENVVELASKTREGVESSGEQMGQLLDAMHNMSDLSKEMHMINSAISNIAFQTRILAINASIEAAAAGAAGKGFAVVANEVGNLAAKCGDSASQITSLIEHTALSIENSMKLAETVSVSFDAVSAITDEVEKNITEISAASQEQAACIDTVAESIDQIYAEVQNTSESAQKASDISEKLKFESDKLKNYIHSFKLSE